MPKNFEQYSFSRMFNFNNLEFFFILGINDSDNSEMNGTQQA